ncbi:hypothetical protein [Methylocystis rosea]|uniref:hypothetical protein n=1 Tax=Methylocystis rosea TaxID=173366 RepID=UPI0003600694|nr:hypothetical protein [Methylocystis rosea]
MSCVKIALRNDLEVSAIEFRSNACAFSVPPLPEPAAIVLAEMLRGPPGPIGGYTHVQLSASAAWTINHNLGVKPTISLYSVGGVEFEGQITHVTDNQAVINLATSIAGFARCS